MVRFNKIGKTRPSGTPHIKVIKAVVNTTVTNTIMETMSISIIKANIDITVIKAIKHTT